MNKHTKKITALVVQFERAKKKLSDDIDVNFRLAASELLKNKLIKKIGWAQYTPYFNDGDACVFTVGRPYAVLDKHEVRRVVEPWMNSPETSETINVLISELIELSEIDPLASIFEHQRAVSFISRYDFDEELKRVFDEVYQFDRAFSSIPDSVFLEMFGNHVVITIDLDKITISDYELHD